MKAWLIYFTALVHVVVCAPSVIAQSTQIALTSSYIHPTYNVPWYGELEKESRFSESDFISTFTQQYLPNQHIQFKEVKRSNDNIGITHVRYQQYINSIKVQHGLLILHIKNQVVESFNGEIYSTPNADLGTNSFEQVLSTIKIGVYPFEPYTTLDTNKFDHEIVYCPTIDGQSLKLGYQLFMKSANPLREDLVYVDAFQHQIIRVEPQLVHTDSVGSATTYYKGTQAITTDFVGANSFRMKENSRSINTYETTLGNYVTDADNNWNTSGREIAGDVHYGAGKVYDFMDSMFNWNSYANNGDSISSVLNFSGGGNAFWNLADNYATFLVATTGNVLPCASLDVVGHEFGHGIADENAGLVYTGEACMLHESFADITGSAIEYFDDSAKANWLLGDQVWVSTNGIRNMSNPKAFNHPDTYKGTFWGTGCHGNGGVQNYWFYLMLAGDTGTNDNGHLYDIKGMGRDSALQVMYRAMFYYVTPNTQFKDMATYTLKAAKDLYGSCGPELKMTWDAWEAVGIVDTTVNLLNLDHGIMAPSLRCASLPADQVFVSKGDPSREVFWDLGGFDTASTQSVKLTFTNYDKYPIYLTTTVCNKVFYDTLNYRINPQPEASFDLNKIEFCKGYDDTLTATNTTINFDKKQELLYKWRVEPYDIDKNTKDFKMSLKDKSYFFSIELETYYKTGCKSKVQEFVTPVEVAIADFKVKSVCKDDILSITNLTDTSRKVTFNWLFHGLSSGDKRTSKLYEPIERFQSFEEIEVVMTMSDTATKCTSIAIDTINVNPLPNPTFTWDKACYLDTITLQNTTTHGAKITWFKWDFGFYEPFNKDTVTYVIDHKDSIVVGLEVRDDNQCKVKAYKSIPIDYVKADFTDPVACQNSETTFNNSSIGEQLNYLWLLGDNVTSNEKNPITTFDSHGKSSVTLNVFDDQCSSSITREITVLPAPQIQINVDGVCVGSPTIFTNKSTNVDSLSTYQWKFADGNTSQSESPTHQYGNTTTETYFVNIVVENTNGCSNQKNKAVTINSLPHCGFQWSYTWPDRSVIFVPDSTDYVSYTWTFDDNNSSQLKTPEHSFTKDKIYDVTLSVTDKYGCTCSETKTVDGSNISVEKHNIDSDVLSIFPNPNTGNFTISIDYNSIISLKITDVRGQIVYDNAALNSRYVETGINVPGVYFATIQLENKLVTTSFIIKSN